MRFEKPPKPLKNDRLVARFTLRSIRITEMPDMHALSPNSPFVTVAVGESQMFETEEEKKQPVAGGEKGHVQVRH